MVLGCSQHFSLDNALTTQARGSIGGHFLWPQHLRLPCVAKQHFGHVWRDKADVNRHAEPVGLVAARLTRDVVALRGE